jgi:Amt family ammonium transporter
MRKRTTLYRVISIIIGIVFVLMLGLSSMAQEGDSSAEAPATETVTEEVVYATMADVETVQFNLNMTWLLLAGFLVFFMQAGFAMVEGGFIRHTGVVNSMAENFMDAALTGIAFFAVGYGLAYGASLSGFIGTDLFFLNFADGTNPGDGALFVSWFYQFAFAGAAGTIVTGATAERVEFRGKVLYSFLIGLVIYPVVVHWVWQGSGWLTALGFHDFAGSTVVHQVGGIIGLVGAIMIGPRLGRKFGSPPAPSNMMLATLGTFILWFGWYGFNVGSTLAASDPNIMGLVAVNTTLAPSAAALLAMTIIYVRTKKWDLGYMLNGSLAGLVGITAGCAFVTPIGAIAIGLTAGAVLVFALDMMEKAKVDDAVGAFAVHGAAGMFGTLAIGFWGVGGLTLNGSAGLFMGGGIDLLVTQAIGVIGVTAWTVVTSVAMWALLKVLGVLRISEEAEKMGIDVYEHGATLYGDLLPLPEVEPAGAGD